MLGKDQLDLLAGIADCEIRPAASMSKHTSLGVGGPADALAIPETRRALTELLAVCRRLDLPVFVLGRGFNVLALESGVAGVVVALWRLRHVEVREGHRLCVEAGTSHGTVTQFCVREGLAGLEFACGIPGTVGGWIAMNAGIPDREMCDVLERIEVAHADGEESWTVAEMGFRYRGAGALTPGRAVVAGVFAMTPDDPEQIRSRVDHYMKQRAESQPINRPSCGSVFKNPEGDFAGRLIEAAGMKGSRSGLAMISDRHANFIVTERGARAEDVLFLIERARQRVFEESGVALVPEVRIIGRGADDLDLPLERES